MAVYLLLRHQLDLLTHDLFFVYSLLVFLLQHLFDRRSWIVHFLDEFLALSEWTAHLDGNWSLQAISFVLLRQCWWFDELGRPRVQVCRRRLWTAFLVSDLGILRNGWLRAQRASVVFGGRLDLVALFGGNNRRKLKPSLANGLLLLLSLVQLGRYLDFAACMFTDSLLHRPDRDSVLVHRLHGLRVNGRSHGTLGNFFALLF